jgi:hypothetical protein
MRSVKAADIPSKEGKRAKSDVRVAGAVTKKQTQDIVIVDEFPITPKA